MSRQVEKVDVHLLYLSLLLGRQMYHKLEGDMEIESRGRIRNTGLEGRHEEEKEASVKRRQYESPESP